MILDKLARTREQKKKAKSLARELEVERSKNVALQEALERSLKENRELQAGVSNQGGVRRTSARDEALQDGEIEFNADNGLCSTRRMTGPSFEETKFFSSMNQLSVASINVPECKATDDDGIHRHTYEQWKDLLIDSLKLAGIQDEATKFTVFKVKAGASLLEIYRNTKSDDGSPDPTEEPFSNALHRLQSYFGSGSDVMLMRRRLAMMIQRPDETDLNFITRVGSTARLCEFDAEKEFEQIVSTVAEHSRNRDVRTTALKMLNRRGTFIDLVDKVREIETIRLNEEYVTLRHGNAEQALIAPVQSFPNWEASRQQRHPGFGSRGGFQQRGNYRGNGTKERQMYRGGSFQSQTNRGRRFQARPYRGGGSSGYSRYNSSQEENCWRCGGVYHSPNDCNVKDKTCNKCGQVGHIQRVCFGQFKRAGGETSDAPPKKIAAVEVRGKAELESKVEEVVSEDTADQ